MCQELVEEYEQVKTIVNTLESFKIEKPADFPVALQDEPVKDPAVWPPPVPAEHRCVNIMMSLSVLKITDVK